MKPRIIVLWISVLLWPQLLFAQDVRRFDTSGYNSVRAEMDLKTGNTLDVLTNFFQLALQDLGSANKHFVFKSTLFGIKASVDSTLRVDTNFRKEHFSRNLQFEVGLYANENFKPVGISGGVTYALINNRDRKEADFRNTQFTQAFEAFSFRKKEAERSYRRQLTDSLNFILRAISKLDSQANQNSNSDAIDNKLDSLLQIKTELITLRAKFNDVTNGYAPIPATLQAAYDSLHVTTLHQNVIDIYDDYMLQKASLGLLTMSVQARTDNQTNRFTGGNLELVYLKGMSGKRRVEADVRTLFNATDTLTPDQKYRYDIDVSGGANIIVWQSKYTNQSLLEIKPNLAYNAILSRRFPDEENYFCFNVDIRLRITGDIWIPFVVKYDLKNQNFLGFLNVSANLDAFHGLFSKR